MKACFMPAQPGQSEVALHACPTVFSANTDNEKERRVANEGNK